MAGEPMEVNQIAAALRALCGFDFHLSFSDTTGKWYVEAPLEISDGVVLGGIVEHRDTPDGALRAFWARIVNVKPDEHLRRGGSQVWRGRWNGFMWEEMRDGR